MLHGFFYKNYETNQHLPKKLSFTCTINHVFFSASDFVYIKLHTKYQSFLDVLLMR